ncbi:MAG TPA: nodulation protein NfeD, partial [Elusimicrobiota bacterium]|nr:nodulation protein NfeD [Elusimicrobiota bacterium]
MSLLAAALLCAGLARAAPARVPARVLRVEARGVIDPPMSEYIRGGLAQAREEGDAAVLIELDTPGGLLDSTHDIVEAMLNSPLPVIVYISPEGARAASAGVFVTMAADVAAMAPGTHLGAAHPVGPGGSELKGTMARKVVSDAAADMRALAAEKGRNALWAEEAVRKSVSLTAREAAARKVVDLVVPDEEALFGRLEGRVIVKRGARLRLDLAGASVREYPMSPLDRFLQVVADPDVALVFLMIGFYGLIYEFGSGGSGLGAAAAVVSLVVAGYAMSLLPVNGLGLLLILAGFALLALDLHLSAHGLLAFAGLGLLSFGAYVL